MTGTVHIDSAGDTEYIYTIQIFSGDQFINIGEYSLEDDIIKLKDGVEVTFIGGKTEIPLDRPVCGWKDELCSETTGRT